MISALLFLCAFLVGPIHQSPLQAEAASFAEAWAAEDVNRLRELMDEAGIRLHLPEEEHQLIQPRQAGAAIGTFLERYSQGVARVGRVSTTGDDQEKGFAEIRWTAGSPRVTEPVIFTLFVGFSWEGEGWTVTEIRVLFR